MARRVLVTGNCNSQYLAAALRACTNLDIRVFSEPSVEGPIHFNMVLPPMISLREGLAWLRESEEKPILLSQTSPMYSEGFPGQQLDFDYDLVKYPFIRYSIVDIRNIPEGADPAKLVRRALRSDAIFNELSLNKAGFSKDEMKHINAVAMSEPSFYTNSHFVGRVHAQIFSLMAGSALDSALGEGGLAKFLEAVGRDIGIAHSLGAIPHASVWKELGVSWTLNDLIRARMTETSRNVAVLRIPGNGVVDFGIFRAHQAMYAKTKRKSHLLACMQLYKRRRHLIWTTFLVDTLLERRRPLLAALVMTHRLAWDDARGSTLALVLARLQGLRRSRAARRLFASAAKLSDSRSLQLADACLRRMEP